ncbi:MAG: ABC transporter substrate-binding protein [Pannonibacter sp.]
MFRPNLHLATAAIFLFLSGISTTPGIAQTTGEKRPLVIADSRGDYGLLAPFTHMKNGPAYLYTSYIFDTLVAQDKQGNPVPGLATAWTRSTDGLSWEVELDDRARWHDGKPVTAEDVAFTVTYMAEHPYAFASTSGIASVEVLTSTRLKLQLKQSDAGFVSGLLTSLPILPQHIYSSISNPEVFAERAAATGSGPYILETQDKAQGRYLLRRNEDYYRGTPLYPAVAIVKMSTDAAIVALKSGEIDVITDVPLDRAEAIRSSGFKLVEAPSNHPMRLTFNHAGPFGAKAARQALAHVIDRQALVDIAYRGAAVVADPGFFQKGSPWRDPQGQLSYPIDISKANALLTSLGWSRDEAGRWSWNNQPVTLRLVAQPQAKAVATAVTDQLEAFGLAVDLRLLEPAQVQQQIETGTYELALFSSSTLGDPVSLIRKVFGPAFNSDRFPDHPELRKLLQEQAISANAADRLSLLHKAQALYAAELPSLFLVNPIWATAHNDRVSPTFLPDGVAIGIPMAMHQAVLLPPVSQATGKAAR